MCGEYEITARPLLYQDPEIPAVLLLTAEVTEDHGQGAAPWLNEMAFFSEANGFGHPHSLAISQDAPPEWTLRIATDYPSGLAPRWLALRAGPLKLGKQPDHFFLGALDLPERWVSKARAERNVLVCHAWWASPRARRGLDSDALDELIDDHTLIVRRVPVADDHDPPPRGRIAQQCYLAVR
jgi:hypothetical protein